MAKRGMEAATAKNLIRQVAHTTGWALCVGAGTSVPVFPDWKMLVRRLVYRDKQLRDHEAIAAELLGFYSPDALIQAAQDRLHLKDRGFAEIIAEELYADFRELMSDAEWRTVSKAFCTRSAGTLHQKTIIDCLTILERVCGNTSAAAIAESIVQVIGTDLAPSAILSFNAEPLLFALISVKTAQRFSPLDESPPKRGELAQHCDPITRGISARRPGRVPFIFCHGLLPVPGQPLTHRQMESTDKLVFSEGAYLQLSNTNYSWQATSFIDACSSRSVVFVGVSLADPNMRRWLSWIHMNRMQEILDQTGKVEASTVHYWIQKAPSNADTRLWQESSVAHLGVRIVWIDSWQQVGDVFRDMLGIKSALGVPASSSGKRTQHETKI